MKRRRPTGVRITVAVRDAVHLAARRWAWRRWWLEAVKRTLAMWLAVAVLAGLGVLLARLVLG